MYVCMSPAKDSDEEDFLSTSNADRVMVWSRHTFLLEFKAFMPCQDSGAFLLDTKLP